MRAQLVAIGLVLAAATGCSAPGAAREPSAPKADEPASLLCEALRWSLDAVLGDRDLGEWIVVVDAPPASQQVVAAMDHPSVTTVMPHDIEVRPVGLIDRQSGKNVIVFALAVGEVSDAWAEVTVLHDCGTRCGGAHRLRAVPEVTGWRVESSEVLW